MNEKQRRGRPKKDNSFDREMEFRATREHERMLDELATKDNKTRGEVMREALERFYDLKIMGQMTYFE